MELTLTKVVDAFVDMDSEERAALDAVLEEGARDFENGDHMDARKFLAQLRAKNA